MGAKSRTENVGPLLCSGLPLPESRKEETEVKEGERSPEHICTMQSRDASQRLRLDVPRWVHDASMRMPATGCKCLHAR